MLTSLEHFIIDPTLSLVGLIYASATMHAC